MKHALRIAAAVVSLIALGLAGGFQAIACCVLALVAYALFVVSGLIGAGPASPPRRSARLRVRLPTREYSEGAVLMRLFTNRKYPVTFVAVDADGNPAPIDGAASFSVTPPEAGTFRAPNPDNADEAGLDPNVTQILEINRDFVEANGAPTGIVAAQITATADADRGDGVRQLVASGAFEFALPEATAAEIVIGDGLPLSA
jgi:hypothetical protein